MIKLTAQDYNQGISSEINCFGDSLTQGAGAISSVGDLGYAEQLANLLYPRLVINQGIGGQTMEQIACRQGAMPIYLTISGNALNGNNNVSITNISNQFLSTLADTATRYASGILNGVPCLITRTVVSSVETYVIRGANTSVAKIPVNSIFYPDSSFNALPTIQLLWWGRNNLPNLTGLDSLIEKAITIMPSPRRFIVIGVLAGQGEIIGTVNYTAITNMNAILLSNYPNNYIPTTPPTLLEMSEILYTPNAQDNIDISNGIFPSGMRYDGIHLNGLGYRIIANRVSKLINQYNW